MVKQLSVLGGVAVLALVAGCGGSDPTEGTGSTSSAVHGGTAEPGSTVPNGVPFANPSGFAATTSTAGSVDLGSAFFQNFGTNGRTCGSCHTITDGWTVTPPHIQARFDATGGTDPIFRTNDGSVSPSADVSTVAARRVAYSMLLTKGDIRVGIGIPSGADFDLTNVDDPYGHANSSDLSLFRRPLPSTNLGFDSTVMWDGRETFGGTDHCNHANEGGKCFASITFDLQDQANGATMGHAQGGPLSQAERAAIQEFESSLSTAQVWDNAAHNLTARGALGGPDAIASQVSYYGINDNLGDYVTGAAFTPNVFDIYDAWSNSPDNGGEASARAAVARGEALFNTRAITISGVSGLNFNSPFNPPLPTSFTGACTTCHDTPNGGNHSIVAPLNIGLTGDHPEALARTPDMPLYTLTCNATGIADGHCNAGDQIKTTDPGRALISGSWKDIGKFKGPILRGLASRAPYFHNGSAADLDAVVDFYDNRFGMGLSDQEHSDLVAFLRTL